MLPHLCRPLPRFFRIFALICPFSVLYLPQLCFFLLHVSKFFLIHLPRYLVACFFGLWSCVRVSSLLARLSVENVRVRCADTSRDAGTTAAGLRPRAFDEKCEHYTECSWSVLRL